MPLGRVKGNVSGGYGNQKEILGHESKSGMVPIEAVDLFGNVADLFFPTIHSYKPNLQLRNMMGIAR
jgi:hypothetical protein